MKTGAEGFRQCYNAQMAVDGEHRLIAATQLNANANDQGAMAGLLNDVAESFEERPGRVLANAGYRNGRDLSAPEGRSIDGHVAPGREGGRRVDGDARTHPATHRMVEKPSTGRERYAPRKWLSEAPDGRVREVPGFRRFSVRGLPKARGEWDLVRPALNIKRLQPLPAA